MKRLLPLLIAFLLLTQPAEAAELEKSEIRVGEGTEQLVLYLSEPLKYKYFSLSHPERLVVDLPAVHWRQDSISGSQFSSQLIKQVRVGQFNSETTRVVVDLIGAATVRQVFELSAKAGSWHRLVFEMEGVGTPLPAGLNMPTPIPRPSSLEADQQKPLVVIDPGHGGVDPGAIAGGVKEKDITLRYARALQDALLATGNYRAELTRRDDQFVLLRGRIRVAQREHADIFISLHADSAPSKNIHGLSLYTLSENASDEEAAALAAAENKVDVLSGIDLSHERADVASILIDLAQRETNNKSSQLAVILQEKLKQQVELLPKSHRFAGFAVLKAPDIPSVLIEMGFISNAKDRQSLLDAKYQDKVIRGIVKGIDHYFETYSTRR